MSYIKIKDISKSYNSKKIIDNLNLSIEKGKFVSFVGAYGTGKTTLLKLLAGIEKIDKGTIFIDGCSPEVLKEKRKIGFAFQHPMLLPWRNVLDNILLPSEFNNEDKTKEAEKLLELVELKHKKDVYPSELSGGMQRIVSILRAIILNPSILLLDEPLSAIDEINRDELHEKLIEIHNKNKQTTILVTHSIHEAVYLSDEVYIMGGSPAKIIKKILPKNPRVKSEKFNLETMRDVSTIKEELRGVIKNA